MNTKELMKEKLTDEQLAKIGITNEKGQHEKDAYIYKLYRELTVEQAALFNKLIYYSPDHIDYYIDYNSGNYDECYEYAMENKHLSSLDMVPEEHKDKAKFMVNSWLELINGDEEIVEA